MRCKPLHSGVEFELRAALGFGLGAQPVEQRGAMPAGASLAIGDEIIDVKIVTGKKFLEEAVARQCRYRAIDLEGREVESSGLHRANSSDKFTFDEMRPELLHDRKTTRNLGVGLSESDGHGGFA